MIMSQEYRDYLLRIKLKYRRQDLKLRIHSLFFRGIINYAEDIKMNNMSNSNDEDILNLLETILDEKSKLMKI